MGSRAQNLGQKIAKELPKNSVVAIIDESKHVAGTAYVAAFRYQVDDRQPYVFRTTDFGKTWIKIVNGIRDGHFARSVALIRL